MNFVFEISRADCAVMDLRIIWAVQAYSILRFLTFKAPIQTAADDIYKYFFIGLQRK